MIAGVSGVLASIASLMFILDNLMLQRVTLNIQQKTLVTQQKDLREQINENKKSNEHFDKQNAILRVQQAENTFFNLLEHNKRLYDQLGFNLGHFSELNTHFETSTTFYTGFMNAFKFHSSEDTQMYPKIRLLNDGIRNSTTETFIKNIADIIEFIELNFKESDKASFYHKIFYNNMSVGLKTFLGICIDYKMFNTNISPFLIYSELYNQKYNLYKSSKPAFPIFHLTRKPTIANGEWEFRNFTNINFIFDIIEIVKPTNNFFLRGYKILMFNSFDNELIYDNGVTLVNENISSLNTFNISAKDAIERARFTTSENAIRGYAVLVLYIEFEKDDYKVFQDFDFSYYYQNNQLLTLNFTPMSSTQYYHERPDILQNVYGRNNS